jgi:hypothetical protein
MEMKREQYKAVAAAILISLSLCVVPPPAWSRVVVHDLVVPKAQNALLQIETKGRFFPKGGEQVEVFVGGTSLGKTLSGGDGMAYKPFVPKKAGLYPIEARWGEKIGAGALLALNQNAAIVLVDVEGALLNNPITRQPLPGSRHALETIAKQQPVVFLRTGLVWVEAIKGWLAEHAYAQTPVLPWNGGAVLDDMADKGITVKAFICGANLVDPAAGRAEIIFCFDEVEGSVRVTTWQEIVDRLNSSLDNKPTKPGKHP